MNKIIKDLEFAFSMHKGQVRKYSGEAYIIHPVLVSQICQRVTDDENTIIGAILHDIIEDSDGKLQDIQELFGQEIATIVQYCSEISSKDSGNREYRKKIDREHYCNGNNASKIITISDAIHNCSTMQDSQSKFTQLYYSEKVSMVNDIVTSLDKEIISPQSRSVEEIAKIFLNMIDNWNTIGVFAESIK